MAHRVTRQGSKAVAKAVGGGGAVAPGENIVTNDVPDLSVPDLEPSLSTSFVVQQSESDIVPGERVPSSGFGAVASVEDSLAMHITNLKNQLKIAQKRLKSFTRDRIVKEAMRIYYHENKSDITIINDVRTRLRTSGLLPDTPIPGKKDVIHWSNIKMATDHNFNTVLTETQRNEYYTRAHQRITSNVRVVV